MHSTEYKVKILDIDAAELRKRMKQLGITTYIKRMMKRHVYNISDDEKDMLIGLRDEGEAVVLSVKDVFGDDLKHDEDVEVTVDNFEKANRMLERLGFVSSHYQEHRRISFKMDDAEVHVDYWPQLPPYMEIIANDEDDVEKTVKKLGFRMSDTTTDGVVKVYKKHGINMNELKDLKF